MSDAHKHETVLDIDAEQVGKTYARAMLGAASNAGVADEVMEQLSQIVDEALAENPKLAAAFSSLRIEPEEKIRVLDRVFGDSVHPILLRTMKIMVRRGRLGYLGAVRTAAVLIQDEILGRTVAQVRTAVPLTDALRSEVIQRISGTIGKEIRLRETVDESVIGGMVIRVGDTIFDSSVASRIDQIGRSASRGFARQLLEQSDRFTTEA